MLPTLRAIGFDLDGTLVDSLDLSAQWMTKAATLTLGQPVPESLVRSHFGKPEAEIFRAILKEEEAEKAFRRYGEILDEEAHQLKLFAGAAELLEDLGAAGFPLALFTSRGRPSTERILAEHGLARFFRVVLSGEQVKRVKPDPEGILRICEELGVEPGAFLYLGDSPADVQAAERAGARGYQALWAPGTSPYGAYHLRSLAELRSLLPQR